MTAIKPIINDHGVTVHEILDLEAGGARIADLTTSNVAAVTAALAEGIYDILPSADTFIAVAPDPSGVTTATGYCAKANVHIQVIVRGASKIGAILASATGTVQIMQVG